MSKEEIEQLKKYYFNECKKYCYKYNNNESLDYLVFDVVSIMLPLNEVKLKQLNILINELTKKRDRIVELDKIGDSNV